MGGTGLSKYFPRLAKIYWSVKAQFNSDTSKSGTPKPAAGAVGESTDPLVAKTVKNFRALLKTNPELAKKVFKQNGDSLTEEQLAKVREALPELVTSQGANSKAKPNIRELGLPEPIADVPAPKASSQRTEMGAYHNKYEHSGDPNITGIAADDVRLKAHKEALIAGSMPMSEHTENLRIVLGDESEVQNALNENKDQYDQVSDWHRNR